MKSLFIFLLAASFLRAEPVEGEKLPTEDLIAKTELFSTSEIETISPPPVIEANIAGFGVAPEKKFKSPAIAAGLASLFPGLGHVYLEDYKTAGALAGGIGGGIGAGIALMDKHPSTGTSIFMTAQTMSQYGIYAAYRDARGQQGLSGYSYRMPVNSFQELVYAPFDFSVMKKPEVWGGVLGALGIALTASYLVYDKYAPAHCKASSDASLFPAVAFPVGIGEESLFRGFLQSSLMENLNPPAAIALSSIVFGAAHIPNAFALEEGWERRRYYAFSLPLITGLGAYFGYLTHKNRSLKESVAVHAWYDFTLFAMSAFAAKCTGASIKNTQYSLSIPF